MRENPTFVVLIRSNEANYQLREAVRKTWCSKAEKPDFSCVFLVGRDHTLPKEKIKLEYNHYHDILMEDFEGTFSLLSKFTIYFKMTKISKKF